MRRRKRYLHRRMVRFPYLIHIFYGVRKPWWPHRLSERIEKLETLRKYHLDEFRRKIDADVSASVGKRYGKALSTGEMSEDEYRRRLGLLQAAGEMLRELGIFADMEWRAEMRRLTHLCILDRAFRKLNPYLDSYDDLKEPVFEDRVRLKEMVLKMGGEPYMDRRREILMEYAKDAWHYDVSYVRIWKIDAEKKEKEHAWNSELE